MSSSTWMLTSISSGFGTVCALGVEVAMLVVVTTRVRRFHPNAFATLLASSVITLAATAGSAVSYALIPTLFAPVSDKLPVLYAANGIMLSGLRTVAGVLLVIGLVQLATPGNAGPTKPQ